MILIDEPELSLHVDWQRKILGELIRQAGERQIIACTHSPEVAAEHPGAMTSLKPQQFTRDQQSLFTEEPGPDGVQ